MSLTFVTDTPSSAVATLQRRLQRERSARREAEAIAERGMRELYQKKEQLQLLGAIAVAANEAQSSEELLHFVLSRICDATEWSIGHAYGIDVRASYRDLLSTHNWGGKTSAAISLFQGVIEQAEFTLGVDLAGRALLTGKPSGVADYAEEEHTPIVAAARQLGICSGVAVPVFAGGQVASILEFFSEHLVTIDEFFLELLGQVATQIGRVLERKHCELQLIYKASHDPLTKLPNRAYFMERLTRAVARTQSRPEAIFTVLFIDLDRFKVINDSLGHNAGDLLLIQVAHSLSAVLRDDQAAADVPFPLEGERNTIARLGGDEFTVLLDNPHTPHQALGIATKVQEVLALPFNIGDHDVYVGASVGITTSKRAYTSPIDVLRDADLAMYRAKALGGSRHIVYDESMHAVEATNLQIEAGLHRAINDQSFVLHYQPVIELTTGRLVGLEALIRWRTPEGKIVSPAEFIGVAEETGLIIPIGTWVLREACLTMHRLQSCFVHEPPLTISVNFSGKQLLQRDVVEQVTRVISETGINPRTLCLEITESVTMGDAERTMEVLAQLNAFGVRFSIDDFGTGFSSLSYLHKLPVHILKIDRSFVNRMNVDVQSLSIVRTIVDLARSLRLEVIAEGIETEAQAIVLAELECKFGQGYLFSGPLNSTSVDAYMQTTTVPSPEGRCRATWIR